MDYKDLIHEAYNELMEELGSENPPSRNAINLGNLASQLARSKGELKTLLYKAEQLGIIKQTNGKIAILDKNKYLQVLGDLPRKIKDLQQKLEPDPTGE